MSSALRPASSFTGESDRARNRRARAQSSVARNEPLSSLTLEPRAARVSIAGSVNAHQLGINLHLNDEYASAGPRSARPPRILASSVHGTLALAFPWVLAFAGVRLLELALALHPPQADEGALLRWLRVFPDHPVRVTVAVGLLIFALRPPRAFHRRRPP